MHTALEDLVLDSFVRLKISNTSALIALSGGSDSMALASACLNLSKKLNLDVSALIVDHGLRSNSLDEANQVSTYVRARGLKASIVSLGMKHGSGIEARARAERYAALEQFRVKNNIQYILTAHTANDQAETLLMRLGRGSALCGVSGILERRGSIIRPMLSVTKSQVMDHLNQSKMMFVSDPMNFDKKFHRVAVRSTLIPVIVDVLGESSVKHLAQFSAAAAVDEDYLKSATDAAYNKVHRANKLDSKALLDLHPALQRRIVAQWLSVNKLSVSSKLIINMLDGTKNGDVTTLPRDMLMIAKSGWLTIVQANN